ncbi:hypothetical protein ACNJD8_21470, partial [Mycobacterium tuberculosis]
AGLVALALTGCAGSTRSTLPSSPRLPAPPAVGVLACLPTPINRQADGSATSADAEAAIRTSRADLARCDARRQLLLDAWPR